MKTEVILECPECFSSLTVKKLLITKDFIDAEAQCPTCGNIALHVSLSFTPFVEGPIVGASS